MTRVMNQARPRRYGILVSLWSDKLVLASALILLVAVLCAVFGPLLIGGSADGVNMRLRNLPPFQLEHGLAYILGADSLGRSLALRLIEGASNTLGVAFAAVCSSMIVGGVLGLIAGYFRGFVGDIIMRAADVIMSFPSLLSALIVLYLLGASITNLIIVLAITRIPVYLRTARAEVLEVSQRAFVTAAIGMGASRARVMFRHILPIVMPTLVTIAAVDFAAVIIAESGLSFLGLGVQPPEYTWGSMVATGRNYLTSAWWLAFWPGLAVMLTTLSLNILSSWLRMVSDPQQRWRVERSRAKDSK